MVTALALVGIIAVASLVVALWVDEPMRRKLEARLNANLDGYRATIGTLDFHPLGFSIDFEDVKIVQEAAPDPPVAFFPRFTLSVQWQALIFGRLVADCTFRQPRLHITLTQAEREAKDPVPVTQRGWQDALQSLYPLKINEFRIIDGDVTYVDRGPLKPMHVTHVDFRAKNIRNVKSREGEYPSEVRLDADVLESARLRARGHADFLATPHAGFKADVDLQGLRLDYLQPIIRHYDLEARQGRLSANGNVEYAPRTKAVVLRDLTVQNAVLDYINRRKGESTTERAATEATKSATTPEENPEVNVRVDRVHVAGSRIGFMNQATKPPYEAYLADLDITLNGFSNERGARRGDAKLRGKFMGSGAAAMDARFQPATKSSDFDLDVSIENVNLPDMNDILRAHGGFDVAKGGFSFYSELAVRNGYVQGYVKPLFFDIDVYDPEQDKKQSLRSKIYEGVVGGVAKLFENRPREQVATKYDISGPVENPKSSVLQIVVNLVQNAFFKGILPGLEQKRANA